MKKCGSFVKSPKAVAITFLSVAVLGLVIFAWSENQAAPLDSFQEGDIMAKPGDIRVLGAAKSPADTRFQVRTYMHPRIKDLFSHDNGKLESRESNFLSRDIFKAFRNQKATIYGSSDAYKSPSIENDGTNILITQHIGLNKDGEAYKLTITVRQGKQFWERSLERGTGYEHPTVTKPATVNPIEGNMYGEGYKSMEETRIGALQFDQKTLAIELQQVIDMGPIDQDVETQRVEA